MQSYIKLVLNYDNGVPGVRTLRHRTLCIWARPSRKLILAGQFNVAVNLQTYSTSALFASRLGYRLPWSILFCGFYQILQENTGILSWWSYERFLPNSFQDTIHWLFIPRYFPDTWSLSSSRKCVRWRSNVPFCDWCVKNCIIYIKRYLNGKRSNFCSMVYL